MAIHAYLTTSINGMIALPNGDAPWSKALWRLYYKLAKAYPAAIVGRTTYDLMLQAGEFKKIGDPFVFVLSKATKPPKHSKHFVV